MVRWLAPNLVCEPEQLALIDALASRQTQYFGVGEISADQVDEYAQQKGMSQAQMERWLAPNLGYRAEYLKLSLKRMMMKKIQSVGLISM